MKIYSTILLVTLAFLFTGCSGFLYTDKPALEFQDIDYTFPVKTALQNPRVAYIDQGTGSEVIVLVHGLASNAGFWRYNIPELAKKYRVIAVDLPGYGKSQKGDYPYKLTWYAGIIKNLLDDLKIKKVNLLGHSMGGQIAIHFSLMYPEYLNKLILASPAGVEEFQKGEGDWLRSVMTINGVKLTPEDGIRRNLANNFYNFPDHLEWMVEERTRMAKASEFTEFCYAVVRSVNAMLDEPTTRLLKNIKTPTLIIHGENDWLIPNPYLNPGFTSDVFKLGEALITGSKRVEIPACGHMLQMEKPEVFNAEVLKFLAN